MILQSNFNSCKPVYLQLIDQIGHAAAAGALRAGEALPSLRPRAGELRIYRNTVAKAYAELESQGVIETVPGKGCFLKVVNSPFTKQTRQKLLAQEIDQAIVAAHHLQIEDADFLGLVRDRLKHFRRKVESAETGKDGDEP